MIGYQLLVDLMCKFKIFVDVNVSQQLKVMTTSRMEDNQVCPFAKTPAFISVLGHSLDLGDAIKHG